MKERVKRMQDEMILRGDVRLLVVTFQSVERTTCYHDGWDRTSRGKLSTLGLARSIADRVMLARSTIQTETANNLGMQENSMLFRAIQSHKLRDRRISPVTLGQLLAFCFNAAFAHSKLLIWAKKKHQLSC